MHKPPQHPIRNAGLGLAGCLLASLAQAAAPAWTASISPGLGTLSQLLGWLMQLLGG